jgi:hypothetical protein
MKRQSLTFLIIFASLFTNAQSSIFHGVTISFAQLDEESNEYIWGENRFLDIKVEMHEDTVTIHHPYQTTRYINGEYVKIDHHIEGWKSIDDRGNSCYMYLIDSEDSTWVRIDYLDRAYAIEIQLYDEDIYDISKPSF